MSKPFFLVCFLFGLFSFRAIRSQDITLNREHASLGELLLQIHEQTGYFFFYSNDDLAEAKPVWIHVSKAPLEEVLAICFAGQPLIYRIENKTITVQKKPSVSKILVDVKGKVMSEEGDPLEDASVELAVTHRAVSTNRDGEFSFEKIPEQSILVFSHVGYQTQTITLSKNPNLTVILKRSVSRLDEVQVIAYGSATQRMITGNTSRLSGEDLGHQPVSNPLAAMEGRMPGVYIQQSSGIPGSNFSVQIRGKNSLRTDGNDPMYIVDGIQFSSTALDNPYTATGGVRSSPLNDLSSSDIESIVVLKDADATAIYGSRGANGVVLITTKKGKPGKTQVNLSFSTGIERLTRTMDLLNTNQYLQMRREAFSQDGATPTNSRAPDLLLWDTTRYTDWEKELIGKTADRKEASASVSGGNNQTQFLFGGSYLKETTVMPGDFSDQKSSFHLSLNNKSENQRFTSSLLASFIHDDRYMPQGSLVLSSQLAPDAPPTRDSTGALNWSNSTWNNPLSYFLQTNQGKTNNLIVSLNMEYQLLPGLFIKNNLGYNSLELDQIGVNPLSSFDPAYGLSSGYTYFSSNKSNSWVAEPEIRYQHKIGKGNLNFQIGGTLQQNALTNLNQYGGGFASDALLKNLQAASVVLVLNAGVTRYHYLGLYSRINFNWNEEWLLNLTARRDGSSRFGPGKQFGNFGALGAGWIFTKERWLNKHLSWLSFGKLRISYGTTGNDQIANYGYLDSYQPTGTIYQGIAVLTPRSLANPDYSWETVRKAEAGIQTGFLKDRILLNISYYQNRSSNQLLGYSLPLITGFNKVSANLPAVVENSGWELEVSSVNVRKNRFSWSSTFNLTIPQNRLIAYPNLAGSTYANSYVVGESIFISKVYEYQGLDPQTGVYSFRDYDKDGKISSPNDRQHIQKNGYRYYGALGNSLAYKNFQLDLFIQFVNQSSPDYVTNFNMPGSYSTSGSSNEPVAVLDHWQSPDNPGTLQRYSQNTSSPAGKAYSFVKSSDQGFANASFARLKNLSISYSFPAPLLNRWHIEQLKIFLQGQDLITLTHYPGNDPETVSGLPPLKTIIAGIQFSL